jgi:25S rRNA (uracil2843-N3)-methyltransferase
VGFTRFLSDLYLTRAQPDAVEAASTVVADKKHGGECRPPRVYLQSVDFSDFSPLHGGPNGFNATLQTLFPKKLAPNCSFCVGNALKPTDEALDAWCAGKIVSLMFVVSELYKTDRKRALWLLTTLRNRMKKGSLLVVADSAGTFSYVQTTESGPKEWVYDVLDKLFLGNDSSPATWSLSAQNKTDSEWYRLPKALTYPLKLQNSRYFLRVFRRE